jgi:hypothetical protein
LLDWNLDVVLLRETDVKFCTPGQHTAAVIECRGFGSLPPSQRPTVDHVGPRDERHRPMRSGEVDTSSLQPVCVHAEFQHTGTFACAARSLVRYSHNGRTAPCREALVASDDDPVFDDSSPTDGQSAQETADADLEIQFAPSEGEDRQDAIDEDSDAAPRNDRPPSGASNLAELRPPSDDPWLESSSGNPEVLEDEHHPPDERDVAELPERTDEPSPDEVDDADFERAGDHWYPQDPPEVPWPDDEGNRGTDDRAQASRFHLYSVDEVLRFPPPRWLVTGLLEQQSLSVLYGPPGEGKSFVALDIGLSVSQGTDWQGRKVKRGPVVYVFGEGGRGLMKRLNAWISSNKSRPDNIFFMCHPVQVLKPDELGALAAQIDHRNLKPRLIVLDTFARCFVGGNENDARDVGVFVDAIQNFQRDIGGAAALIVHHTTRARPKDERGSTALRGAADTMLHLTTTGGKTTLTCTKQKDGEKGKPTVLVLEQVSLPDDEDGAPVTSLVVRNAGHGPTRHVTPGQAPAPAADSHRTSSPRDEAALEVLRESGKQGLRKGEWLRRVNERLKEKVPPDSFTKVRKRLQDDGSIECLSGYKYRIPAAAR